MVRYQCYFNYAKKFPHCGYDISTVLKISRGPGRSTSFHADGARHCGSWRTAAVDDVRVGCAGDYLYRHGILLSQRNQRPAVLLLVLAAIGCYAISLAPVTWVVISEIFPTALWSRHGGCGFRVVDCVFPSHLYFSDSDATLDRREHLALRRDLRHRIRVHQIQAAGTKGKSLEQIERDLVDGS